MTKYNTTVGIDLGDTNHVYCILDAEGEVFTKGRLSGTEASLRRFFTTTESWLVAIEAGSQSAWISRLARSLGHDVVVANSRKLHCISENEQKNDWRDAETLARLARADSRLLHPITHRGPEAQADLAILKARDALVKTRTELINHIRGTVKIVGGRLPSSSADYFHAKVAQSIPESMQPALLPLLDVLKMLTQQIRNYEADIERISQERYPETNILRTVPGVGSLTSLAYILTLEEPQRFAKSRYVPCYLGLIPRKNQSGNSDPQLRITKAGNSYLRRLLVGSAQYILGPFGKPNALRQWGIKLAERGGKNAKKRAIIAVARKLAALLHRLWTTGEEFNPFPRGQIIV